MLMGGSGGPQGGVKLFGLVGLGFWQAWWMVAMCTDVLLPDPARSPFPVSLSVLLLSFSCLGYLIVVLVWKVPGRNESAGRRVPRFALVAAAACSVAGSLGMGAVAHSALLGMFGGSLFVLATAAFSLGNAMLLVTWGVLWSTLATGYVGRLLCVSYTAAFVLFFLVRTLPLGLAIAACAALPLASLAGLVYASRAPRRTASVRREVALDASLYRRALLAIVVANIVWGVTQKYLYVADGEVANLAFAFGGACLLAFTAYLFIAAPTDGPRVLYRPIVPGLVCGIALIVALPAADAFLGEGVMIYGGYCLDMLIMLVASDIAFRTGRPVVLLFGVALFVARLGSLVGTVVGEWCAQASASPVLVAMLCIVALTLVGSVLFSQADLDRVYQVQAEPRGDVSYERVCARLAEECGLTAREGEVLVLLARGRSAPYIGQDLGIAVGTVKNHVSSIYRKLGVCDRQSLHNVIERGSAE